MILKGTGINDDGIFKEAFDKLIGMKSAIHSLGVGTKPMTDLSLHEYGDTLKDDLQKILRQEAMKMFGSTCPKKIIQPRVNASPGLIHHLRYFSRRVFANSLGYFF